MTTLLRYFNELRQWSVVDASQTTGIRIQLTTATTYYVATTGNDSTGDGTVATPWLTIQHAINYVLDTIDLAGFDVTIQLAAGAYAPFSVLGLWTGRGHVTVSGDITTPANVTITGTSADCVDIGSTTNLQKAGGSSLCIQGVQLSTSGSGNCISVAERSYCGISGNMTFASCASNHISVARLSQLQLGASYTISGGASAHWNLNQNCVFNTVTPVVVTLSGTPAFSAAFIIINRNSSWGTGFGVTFSGGATGVRYKVSANAVIDSGGGGANYFPGNSAGTTATGGQYL